MADGLIHGVSIEGDRPLERFTQQVAAILNGLLRTGAIVRTVGGGWQLPPVAPAGSSEIVGENKDVVTLVPGHVVAVHASGTGFIRAVCSDAAKSAVGFVRTGGVVAVSVDVDTDEVLELADWSAVTEGATAALTPNTPYYLSATAGKITPTAPSTGGQYVQRVGWAVTGTILAIEIGQRILL